MTTIALPIWLLILIAAIPCICLLGLAVRAALKGRQKGGVGPESPMAHPGYNALLDASFQHDLHALQIDAVFNALAALIETERLKLKSLLRPAVLHLPELENDGQNGVDLLPGGKESVEKDVSCQIVERTGLGESAGEIAKDLGISQTEVALAISMNQDIADDRNCRLEAVA